MPRFRKAMLQRADDQPAHEACVTKAHFGLGWVYVDIYLTGIQLQVKQVCRILLWSQEIGVSLAHRVLKHFVSDHTPVYIAILLIRL